MMNFISIKKKKKDSRANMSLRQDENLDGLVLKSRSPGVLHSLQGGNAHSGEDMCH